MADQFRRCTKVEFVEVNAPVPPAVTSIDNIVGNAAFASLEKKALLVGGYSPASGTGIHQVLEYDFVLKQWTNLTNAIPLPTKNLAAGAVIGASSSSVGNIAEQIGVVGCKSEAIMVSVSGNNSYYMFGGFNNESGEVVTDMWKLTVPLGDTAAKGAWIPLSCVGGPCARRGHCMAVVNAPPPVTAAPVVAPGPTSPAAAAAAAAAAAVAAVGTAPPETTGGSKIYLFGGFDGTSRLNDLWCYDVDTAMWSAVETQGILPDPRDNSALCADTLHRQLILYGGYSSCRSGELFTLDLDTLTWNSIPVDQGPTPRMSTFAAYCNGFMVTGLGQDVKGASNMVAQYNTELRKWTIPHVDGDDLEPLIHYSWCLSDNGKRVLVYGGTNEKKYSSTLYEIELEKVEAVVPVKGKK